jgi:type IV pilus assembly protein PilP
MGLNHGQVLVISEVEIVLNEIVSDGNGMYVERDSSLPIVEVN